MLSNRIGGIGQCKSKKTQMSWACLGSPPNQFYAAILAPQTLTHHVLVRLQKPTFLSSQRA